MIWPQVDMHLDWKSWGRTLTTKLQELSEASQAMPVLLSTNLPPAKRFRHRPVLMDEAGTLVPIYSDGTDWRRFSDSTVV